MRRAFVGLNADDIQQEVEGMWRTLYKLSKTFADQPGPRRVADLVRTKIEKFKQHMPVLHTICNPGLRERHWRQISDAVGVEIQVEEDTTLAMMIESGLPKVVKKLEEISAVASKEYGLEKALYSMKSTWANVYFEFLPYRETGVSIITSVDEIQVLLDDHILKAQTMRGSPYIRALESEFRQWEDTLLAMQDILDAWLKCQGTWLYLEPIFSSEDILQQMPVEGRKFVRVDRTWRQVMGYAVEHPLALEATSQGDLFKRLHEANSLLDDIQKGLNDYLEKKRLFFPRFFFLSNEELLEILSETKDASRVQPHLRKCFEGIHRLRFTEEQVITGMISEEGEEVEFIQEVVPSRARGLVEKWLVEVEGLMISSLRSVTQRAVAAYAHTDRAKWVLEWPGQVILCASNIHWTAQTTEALGDRDALKEHLRRCTRQIEDIVRLVKDKGLSAGARTTLEALLVIDAHGILVELGVRGPSDFDWLAQLRYYWNEFDSLVTVSMITTEIRYSYEYLGNTGRLVITPLTDRCYRTLMGALRLHLGGAPEGPAGTGKTETCKDLAKAVAKKCVVFNCSEGLDYKAMGKFFKGLAQSGAWACFDEFNRIELEVLSVVAQQVHCLQTAVAQGAPTLHFEGTTLRLDPTCSIFITMNPGYAGRQELPDNLKVLFRTVAMMVPDYALIAENSLYSYGFVNARSLAGKIVDVYRLCSEQLSSQHHYDYGMRAVKAVLTAARNLRLKYPNQDEGQLVLRAILGVNRPKFLAQDIPLFDGIISDLFPGVDLQPPDYSVLTEAIFAKIQERGLQATPWFTDKIFQLYEMILVRHGLMLVGEPMGGKTSAYQILAAALTAVAEMPDSPFKESKVNTRVINPKALELGQLYGCFDKISHEWSDGVLATAFREMAISGSPDRQWLVLDGPVDALWIENLNTVLDDNRKLCLMSGEIIQMSRQMNIIFEVGDLEHASPATVSRCGMIYMEPSRPCTDFPLHFRQIGLAILKRLVHEHPSRSSATRHFGCPQGHDGLARGSLPRIRLVSIRFLVHSHGRPPPLSGKLFGKLSPALAMSYESRYETQPEVLGGQQGQSWLQGMFIFAIIWSIGGVLTGDSRKKFDEFLRQLVLGLNLAHPRPKSFKLQRQQLIPDGGTVYDYVFDRKDMGHWMPWMETMDKKALHIPPNAKVSELLIPTVETARQSYFLKLLLNQGIPLVFVGPTGTGKSAIVSHHLMGLPKEKFLPNVINFSARTTATQTQDIVMSKLDRRRKGVYGPSMGKKCVVFIDDMNLPQKEVFGCQPPLELLRQWLDHGYWYDRKDTSKLEVIDTLLVSAMAPPGGGRSPLPDRLARHLHLLCIDAFDDATLTKIFGSVVDWHFGKGFEMSITRCSKALVQATLEVYKGAMGSFRPTPTKSHYVFNLRDFSRVVRGVLLMPPSHLTDSGKMVRLWVHEVTRSFHDRLIEEQDRMKFMELLQNSCQNHFKTSLERCLPHLVGQMGTLEEKGIRKLFFGDYIYPDAESKVYDEITDLERLTAVMENYLSEHNVVSKNPMSLVMFQFAIEHVSRIARVLRQDSGHALLIGMGGSGRASCSRLAVFMAGYELCQLEMSRSYGLEQWRDDLKRILMKAGGEGKPTAFLFTDTQIKDEAFIEDINMLLNTGDIPNLYPPDERAEILERMQTAAREQGRKIDPSPLSLYNFFVERVRRNLHVILAMSPIGDAFRSRLRMFPSLINCCTIDWFTEWPDDALERVASKFLSDVDLPDDFRERCIRLCQYFHRSVGHLSTRFFETYKRPTYATPTSFLELILTFKNLLAVKRNEILLLKNRYATGLERLEYATSQISVMKDRETALRPQLVALSEETERLMIKIEKDTVHVESQKEIVAADEAAANEAAAAAQAIKDDCENELAEALPALNAAISALNTLKPADITLVKAMKNPPSGVKLVMEAICVMLDRKPERKADPTVLGKYIEDYWSTSQKVLGDLKFLDTLRSYDKANILPHIMKKIREKYILNPDFDPEVIKDVSRACVNLCKWVRAMEVYDRVNKIVAPKKERLQGAERELEAQMGKLKEKRAQLHQVTDKLQALNDEFATNIRRKKELEDELFLCSQKLDRAEKLIEGLGGEKERWSRAAHALGEKYDNIMGDVLMAAAVVAYLGPFTADFRQSCLEEWVRRCEQVGVACSNPFHLSSTLGDAVKTRAWHLAGLPVDAFSVDNAIIVTHARRWPLMIDPQGQANKWIRNLEKDNGLSVIKLTDPNYLRILENALQFGRPILLENIGEELDPILETVLIRQTFKSAGIEYIRLGDQLVEYNTEFRLYMTTRLRNPHYLPEVSVKVTLLNFMLTSVGLEDQLLGIVAARERPQLETQKHQLIVEGADNKKKLKELEDRILQVLAAEGNILDDETGIKVLSSSKLLSEDIKAKEQVIASTEAQIDATRDQYKPVAAHSSRLFFCLSELANIDPMYQYSLAWFIRLYEHSIANSRQSENIKERVKHLNDHFTHSVYRNVCRSLFEKDKLLFSFSLCISILRGEGKLDEEELHFLLTGGVTLDNPHPNPGKEWLSDKSWAEIVMATKLTRLSGLRESFEQEPEKWKDVYDAPNPQDLPFPLSLGESEPKDPGLSLLVILRCLRPDKIVPAVQDFIVKHMGSTYIDPPTFDLAGSFADSSPRSPLIFILSPGADPMAALLTFAEERNIIDRVKSISLGQGQGPIAGELIEEGVVDGGWVVLQNCHLATSWLPTLERLCEEVVNTDRTHSDFRLWLTSYPSAQFPVSILQNGVKMTNEAPKGVRANLLRSYMSPPISDPEFYNACTQSRSWQRLLFGLCFFHALIQERRHFGPLGWNIPYEFNESDLRISVAQLQMFLNDSTSEVPFNALVYLTGECNYGGRVTDDKDRRLLLALLSSVYCPQILSQDRYDLAGEGTYYCPDSEDYDGYLRYIRSLPLSSKPDVFGLHQNAEITKDNQETDQLLNGLLLTQPQRLEIGRSKGQKSPSAVALELATDILVKLPIEFNIKEVEASFPITYSESMNTVLKQEVTRYNRLLATIRASLEELCRAIKGLVLMSSDLEEVFNSLLVGRVPLAWQRKSYPSLKPLGSYISDLVRRCQFFRNWIEGGIPKIFWFSGFFFTQSFLTGVLQNFARKYCIPIDQLSFTFHVTSHEARLTAPAENPSIKRGLHLEGARWDRKLRKLAEPFQKVLHDPLPVITLLPCKKAEIVETPSYECPVYKTSARRGTLSTTGHSTNFVLYITLPTDLPPSHWVMRGVAALSQLCD
ncbi:unnamed protein product [Darwinula stevensoni]|uniref:AAA+ ATPase domain-containing protein n=1 Tax=Darwinula stevensoni TaxID=69355 RepID=A0A7R8X6G7_9CRUS|nr:unnamed protein product [Darwinula stevensoni]CAG0885871.1 unnamed protein product [Darwinula stevensoni]